MTEEATLALRGAADPALLPRLAALAATLPPAAPVAREELLRRDPLRFIPAARRAAAMAPAPRPETGPFAIEPADPDFCGSGWWEAERLARGSLRWSGHGPVAALLLPALGGGALRLTLTLRAPFGIPLDLDGHEILLDGQPLHPAAQENDGVVGVFVAEARLPALPPGARIALLLIGPRHADPAGRETRRLGLGLLAARLERA